MANHKLSIDTTQDPCKFSLDSTLKSLKWATYLLYVPVHVYWCFYGTVFGNFFPLHSKIYFEKWPMKMLSTDR
jgi:hypothetical protein